MISAWSSTGKKLNICSEASCNITQARGDSAVICCPCVPSGSKEERQTTCSHHSSAHKVLHTKAASMESTVPLLSSTTSAFI